MIADEAVLRPVRFDDFQLNGFLLNGSSVTRRPPVIRRKLGRLRRRMGIQSGDMGVTVFVFALAIALGFVLANMGG